MISNAATLFLALLLVAGVYREFRFKRWCNAYKCQIRNQAKKEMSWKKS